MNVTGLFLLANGATSAQNLSIFDPASPPAESIRSLFILVLAITGAIFLLVEGVLIYSIVRFRRAARRRRNRRRSTAACPSRSPGRPRRC